MWKRKFNYDYSKTLWMKMYLATPDFKQNCSDVKINFEQALEIIRIVDNITQGITKIIYLVGWQGLGHDDCYPEMELVNPYLKRKCDDTARDSLLWLYEEAKKYNTVISVHGNISDEYAENKSHTEFVAVDAILKNKDGTPAVIEVFNKRNAYKTSYKQYWESGLFEKYFVRFLEALPFVKEAGTVHLDNFCIAENLCPRTTCEQQNEARNKILDYISDHGIDVTSEYTYRELPLRADRKHPVKKYYKANGEKIKESTWKKAPIRALGRIPAVWWMDNMTIDDCMKTPPSLFSGYLNKKPLNNVFYGTMHGENIWMENGTEKDKWVPLFVKEFCTMQLPYMYLNRYKRVSYKGNGLFGYTVTFSNGVVSKGSDKSISKNGLTLKKGCDIILPLNEDNKLFIAYTEKGYDGKWNMPDAEFTRARVYNITADGNEYAFDVTVESKTVEMKLKAGQAVVIEGIE